MQFFQVGVNIRNFRKAKQNNVEAAQLLAA